MKKRVRRVLSALLAADGYLTASDLAESLNLSRRSVIYALDELDSDLAGEGLSITDRVTNRGIRLQTEEAARVAQFLSAHERDELLDFTDAKDRQLFLLFSFLCIEGGSTTERLADCMQTSVRTVSNDVNALRRVLSDQSLELVYDKKSGYAIDGNAFTLRNLFVQWMASACEVNDAAHLSTVLLGLYELADVEPPCRLGREEISDIARMLGDVVPNHYTKKGFRALLMHLTAALVCAKSPKTFGLTRADKSYLERSVSFDVARIICLRASQISGAELDEDESCYIATLLQSLPTSNTSNIEQNYPFEIEVIVQKLILDVSEGYQYDFNSDPELFGAMVGHVIPLVYRLLFNAQNKNPLLGEIANKYARLHEVVRNSLAGIESYAGSTVTEDECSFITLYFASSVEKMANSSNGKAKVIVVCNAGNAVSRLLRYKLTNAFNVEVLDCVAESELYDALLSTPSVDLVVTVVDLDAGRLGGVPCLKVNPFLSDQDISHLSRNLRQRVFVRPDDETAGASLLELLAPSCFRVADSVEDMDALIEMSGTLLREAGLCDAEYPSQMVSAAHCFGPLTTILIAPGIIMPHAGISDHVYRTGFSFVRACTLH